jgi:hypothetical protein
MKSGVQRMTHFQKRKSFASPQNRGLATIIVLIVALALGGCNTRLAPPASLGTPDLILEKAGDMGRYLLPSETPKEIWRSREKTYFYLDRNIMVTVTKSGEHRGEISSDERKHVLDVLALYKARNPIE